MSEPNTPRPKDPRTCPHDDKEYSGSVITTAPEIHSWVCRACGTAGHTDADRGHYTDCFCCAAHNGRVAAAHAAPPVTPPAPPGAAAAADRPAT